MKHKGQAVTIDKEHDEDNGKYATINDVFEHKPSGRTIYRVTVSKPIPESRHFNEEHLK